jgi:Tol biopolymer transport system component
VLLASVSIALSVLAFLHFREKATEVRPFRFSIYAPEKAIFGNLNSGGAVAVSPDGRRLVFVAVSEGDTSLWVRSLDSLRAVKLTGTQGAAYPFWSPDSRHNGFFAQGKLKRVEIDGGVPQTLCDAEVGLGGTWNRDGVIIFSGGYTEALSTVPADGGRPTPVTALETQNEYSHRWPIFLPDGRHFAYLTRFGPGGNRVYVGTLGSKVRARLLGVDSNVAYASGYLLFVREGTLFAQPFDAADVRLAGEPFPVAEKMGYNATIGHGAFSVSDNGVLAYYPSSATFDGQLTWFDRSGISVGSLGLPGDYNFLNLSPDETKIAASRRDPQTTFWDIWLFDLSRGAMSRFTSHPSYNVFPIWSPDGTRLIFTSNRDGHYDLYQKALSGASNEQILLKSNTNKFPTDWSSDGDFVTYYELGDRKKMHLSLLSLNSFHKPYPVLEEDVNGTLGQLSPDRKWIAYVSRDTGQSEVYVRSLPAPGGKWQISNNGGDQPRWRKDGKELFHVASGKLMATEVNGNSKTFQVGVTKVLFSFRSHGGSWIGPMYLYATNREGKRFLVNTAVEERAATLPITVVANWTAGLKEIAR